MRRVNLLLVIIQLVALSACREDVAEPPPLPPPLEGEMSNEEVLAELERMDRRQDELRRQLNEKPRVEVAATAPVETIAEAATPASVDGAVLAAAWSASEDPVMRVRGRCLAAFAGCPKSGTAADVCVRDLPRCTAAATFACCPAECVGDYQRRRQSGASQQAAAAEAFHSPASNCAVRAVASAAPRKQAAPSPVPGSDPAQVSVSAAALLAEAIPATEVDVQIRRWAGNPIVVGVFASWCPACRRTMPVVSETLARHPEARVLLISKELDVEALSSYLSETPIPGAKLLGPPRVEGGLVRAFASVGATFSEKIPYLAVLDRSGKVVGQWTGNPGAKLEKALAAAR